MHTPGPWLREGAFIYALEDCIFAGKPAKQNRWQCCVQSHVAPKEELEAVAVLMQAAPDLLAELESLLGLIAGDQRAESEITRAFESEGGRPWAARLARAITSSDAAIAKARDPHAL